MFQAFLEMAEEISAVAMVAYFGGCVAQLRGRAVYVQFSNHKELKTDQTHSNAVSHLSITYWVIVVCEQWEASTFPKMSTQRQNFSKKDS